MTLMSYYYLALRLLIIFLCYFNVFWVETEALVRLDHQEHSPGNQGRMQSPKKWCVRLSWCYIHRKYNTQWNTKIHWNNVMYFMSDMNWFGAMETDTDHKGTSQDVVLVSGILAHLQLALLFNEIVTSPIISSLPLHWNGLILEVGTWQGCNKKERKLKDMVPIESSGSSSACRFDTDLLYLKGHYCYWWSASIQDHNRYLKSKNILSDSL